MPVQYGSKRLEPLLCRLPPEGVPHEVARPHVNPPGADALCFTHGLAEVGETIMLTHRTLARIGALCLSGLLLASSTWAYTPAPGAAAEGTWQFHKYSFQFLGFTSTYSCDGLADKLKELLLAAGARADVKSEPGACASGFGRPDKFARADLKFFTLVPLGTNVVPDQQPTPGVWRPVTFGNHSPQDLLLGDCELIEQFRSQVLPMFATRNVVNNTSCIPHQESGSTIDLRFESFAAAPAPQAPPAAPHSGR